jgi:hypothetical protein
MDNASKNAGDMIGSLQMQYNRGRQASITNELVDIITGSLSLSVIARGFSNTRPRCQCLVISENSLECGIDSIARCYPVVSSSPDPLIADLFSPKKCFQRRYHSISTSSPEFPVKSKLIICLGSESTIRPVQG